MFVKEDLDQFVIKIKTKGEVIAYAPSIFLRIRDLYGIKHSEIEESLNPINNREQIFKSNMASGRAVNSNEGGRSGSFFFFSQDKHYIVKTISVQER